MYCSILLLTLVLLFVTTIFAADRHIQHRYTAQQSDHYTLECNYNEDTNDKVQIDYYIMSKCPDAQVCIQQYADSIKQLDGYVNVQFSHIVTEINEDGTKVKCMHGPSECDGDKQQSCIQHQAQARASHGDTTQQLYEYMLCDVKDFKNIPDNAEQCADAAGFDYNDLHNCFNSERGNQLLKESTERTHAAHAKKSCTITVDSEPFAIHDSTWNTADKQAPDLIQAVCAALQQKDASLPTVCK